MISLANQLRNLHKKLRPTGLPVWGEFPRQDRLLQDAQRAVRTYLSEFPAPRPSLKSKINELRHFDVVGIDRIVAICQYGRSGTELLASYLDGHSDVLMLPTNRSQRIYQFCERYNSFSLYEKLIAYPIFSGDFFEGDFAITAVEYYLAVEASSTAFMDLPNAFLASRRAFFVLLHVIYCVALGRREVSTRPMIVYAQHRRNEPLAKCLLEDFPLACFIHMVRDPITNSSRTFDEWFKGGASTAPGPLTPAYVIRHLINSDSPHDSCERRTGVFRFEDLHTNLEGAIRAVVKWLDLPFQPSLLSSTFNSLPWVFQKGKLSWSGPWPQQAVRDEHNLTKTDKWLLFAVFSEDFISWEYEMPTIFSYKVVRIIVFLFLILVPMKIEWLSLQGAIKMSPFKDLQHLNHTLKCLMKSLICRFGLIILIGADFWRRIVFGKSILKLSYCQRNT